MFSLTLGNLESTMPPAHLPERVDLEPQELSAPQSLNLAPGLNPGTSSGNLRKLLVLLVIVSAVAFTAWKIHGNLSGPASSRQGRRSGSGDRAVPVTTAQVQQKTMPIYLTALGTVTAYYSVTIKTRVDGQLTAVNVREGQHVRKGQLLAQIDPSPYAAALAQAQGQLAKDKAAAAYADIEVARYSALFEAGVVTQDSQQTQVANAGQIAGATQVDKAAIQAAKVNLDYTRITSPIDGVVGLRQVDPGNIVHAADATGLLLVTQLQPISVIFTLPEDQLPQVQQPLRKGTRLEVEAYDRSQTTLLATGKLLTLDNQIDTATGTDKIKAVFDNKDGALFPNQFVNVRLILQRRPDTLVIPSAAVQTGSQGSFVFVMKAGPPKPEGSGTNPGSGKSGSGRQHQHKVAEAEAPAAKDGDAGSKPSDKATYHVEVRPIAIDVTEGSQVIVSSGLAAGEQVVIDGMEKLKNGSQVSPRKDTAKSGHKSSKGGDPVSDAISPAVGGNGIVDAHAGDANPKHHHHEQQP
jgi:multidrug efflux system membrane fusion protein